jgi:proton-dependent oligopeptide transporter, POT family
METVQTMRSKILTLLSCAQMCKFFSHFGVRTLLVLYLVEHLHYSDSRAFGINSVFCGLCELGGIFGGIIADRYLGLKKGMLWGGWLLCIGYLSLVFESFFFLSMGLVITGASLFSGNITAMLGLAYAENDPKRKKGFTIFYMMQNLGALISTLICGFIATHYSFRWGFAVASIGMVIGNLILFIYRKALHTFEEAPIKVERMMRSTLAWLAILTLGTLGVWSEKIVLLILPWLTAGVLLFFVIRLLKESKWPQEQVYTLFIFLAGLILFFAVEDQICSSLLLFAERETERTLFGWKIPSAFITSMNPIVILLLGTWVAKRRAQMITPFILTSCAFGVLALLCLLNINCSIFGVMGAVTIISIAELMIGPLVLSTTSELAAKGSPGRVMGMVPIAFSLAFQLSGGFSKMVAIEDRSLSLQIYGTGFGVVAFLMLLSGLTMQLLMRRFSDEKNRVC